MNKDEVLAEVRSNAVLARLADSIEPLLRPAIGISVQEATANIAPGASKFGGLPDVPMDFVWPKYEGQSLAFLGQIRLSDAASHLRQMTAEGSTDTMLPVNGLLSFFYEVEEGPYGAKEQEGGWRVFYFPETAALLPAMAPDDLALEDAEADAHSVTQHTLQFSPKTTLVGWDTPQMQELDLTEEEAEALDELLSGVQPRHHLLGEAAPVQGDVRAECQQWANGLTYQEATAQGLLNRLDEWQLLLELDSDPKMDWMWGDAGKLYFMIRQEDLRARRFENTWLIMQCG